MTLQRNDRLINSKIIQYLLPGMMMTVALQLGNVVDTILIGNILGTAQMSAVNLGMPVWLFLQIPCAVLANGGAAAVGNLLGKGQRDEASDIFSIAFVSTVVIGFIFTLVGIFYAHPLGHLLAKGGGLGGMTADYIQMALIFTPIFGATQVMAPFVAVDNHPQYASIFYIVANLVNLLLDYVFLSFTPMGIRGAALSTILGYVAGLVVFIPYMRSSTRMLKFRRFSGMISGFKQIMPPGMPVLVQLVMSFLKGLILNTVVLLLLGDNGMAVLTVCYNILLIFAMVSDGIVNVIPNLVSILYGEKDWFGIRALVKRLIKMSGIVTLALTLFIMIFSRQLTAMFGISDPGLLDAGEWALRVYIFSLPFYVWNYFQSRYYPQVEKSALASVTSFLENGIILVPAAYFGISIGMSLGGNGYLMLAFSYVLSEGITVLLTFLYRKIKYKGSDFYLIPKETDEKCYDFTIASEISEVAKISPSIISFLTEHGVKADRANMAAVALEEMAANAIKHGGRPTGWIDICTVICEDRIQLRIRDNGIPFDPVGYQYEDKDEYDVHGIEIVKAIATYMRYVRAMDMNNTTLEIAIG